MPLESVEETLEMATFHEVTASSTPTIDPDRVDDLRAFLDEWLVGYGAVGELTVNVETPLPDRKTGEIGDPRLVLFGYAGFHPVHRLSVREAVIEQLEDTNEYGELTETEREGRIEAAIEDLVYDYAGEHTDKFLTDVSVFLTEPLIVQSIGYEKCRLPLSGYQYSVTLDGKIDHVSIGV